MLGSATRLSGKVELSDAAATRFEGDILDAVFGDIDIDGDGLTDTAFSPSSAGADRLFYLFYGRQGGFPAVVDTAEADATFLRPADLLDVVSSFAGTDQDGDGDIDLAIGSSGLADYRGGVFLVPGDGERFAGEVVLDEISRRLIGRVVRYEEDIGEAAASSLDAGDVNGDGRRDLLVSGLRGDELHDHSTEVYVLLGDGD